MLPGAAIALSFKYIPTETKLSSNEFSLILLSFLALCFASSANYVINEWLDRSHDAKHPFKNHRVANNFAFSEKKVFGLYAFLLLTVFGFSQFLNRNVNIYLSLLLVMGLLYNVEPFRFKDKHYLDVISESVNNPIRLAIGWHTLVPNAAVPASAFIGFWGIGIFLMALKRYSEMTLINNDALLASYRKSFKNWDRTKLLVFAMVGALVGASFMGILLAKRRLEYIFVFPLLTWIFAEYLKISLNLDPSSYAPEKLMRNKKLMGLVVLLAILFVIFTFVNVPSLHEFLFMDEA